MNRVLRRDMYMIIKARSPFIIDRRRHYDKHYREAVGRMLEEQMDLDGLRIASDGNLYIGTPTEIDKVNGGFVDYKIYVPCSISSDGIEICSYEEQERRFNRLVKYIIGWR